VPSDQCEFEINSKIHDTGYENHVTLSGEQAPETISSTAANTMYMKHCSRDLVDFLKPIMTSDRSSSHNGTSRITVMDTLSIANSSFLWQAPLAVRSTKRRHQSPEWMILSRIDCFIQREVIWISGPAG